MITFHLCCSGFSHGFSKEGNCGTDRCCLYDMMNPIYEILHATVCTSLEQLVGLYTDRKRKKYVIWNVASTSRSEPVLHDSVYDVCVEEKNYEMTEINKCFSDFLLLTVCANKSFVNVTFLIANNWLNHLDQFFWVTSETLNITCRCHILFLLLDDKCSCWISFLWRSDLAAQNILYWCWSAFWDAVDH